MCRLCLFLCECVCVCDVVLRDDYINIMCVRCS